MDPLAEKYYSLSPYTFCAGNPIIFVDRDGRVIDTAIDAISISLGVKSLISNIQAGNVRAAVFDGVGVAVDVVAAAIPFIPGGVGILRNGAKLVDAADNVADAVKTTVKVHGNSKLSTKAQHAYDIIDTATNTIVKTGVSSGPISKKANHIALKSK